MNSEHVPNDQSLMGYQEPKTGMKNHDALLWPTQEHARVETARSPAESGATVLKVALAKMPMGFQQFFLFVDMYQRQKCLEYLKQITFRVVFFEGVKFHSLERKGKLPFTLARNHESLIQVNCQCEPQCCQEVVVSLPSLV